MKDYSVIVVSQSDKLDKMSRAAVERLRTKLKSGRAVKAEAQRFAERVAAHLSWLRVETYDVVGYCNPYPDRPGIIEPIVIEEGKPVRVSVTHILVAGDYSVVPSTELDEVRDRIVAASARKLAEDVFLGDAMMAAIDEADPDCTLSGMSSYVLTPQLAPSRSLATTTGRSPSGCRSGSRSGWKGRDQTFHWPGLSVRGMAT